MATDACDDVYGVVAAEFAPALVASWGRLQGRHRFRFQSAVQVRKYALGDLDTPSSRETVEDLSGECEGYVLDDSSKRDLLGHLAQHVLDRPSNGPIPSP